MAESTARRKGRRPGSPVNLRWPFFWETVHCGQMLAVRAHPSQRRRRRRLRIARTARQAGAIHFHCRCPARGGGCSASPAHVLTRRHASTAASMASSQRSAISKCAAYRSRTAGGSDFAALSQNEPLRMAHCSFRQDPAGPSGNRVECRCAGPEQPSDLGRARAAGGKFKRVQLLEAQITQFRHRNLLCVSSFLGDDDRACVPWPPAIKTHVHREKESRFRSHSRNFLLLRARPATP